MSPMLGILLKIKPATVDVYHIRDLQYFYSLFKCLRVVLPEGLLEADIEVL